MITAIDTNVIIDAVDADSSFAIEAIEALKAALDQGSVIISELVYAEASLSFLSAEDFESFLSDTDIRLTRTETTTLFWAAEAWSEYLKRRPAGLVCQKCGAVSSVICEGCGASVQARQHLVADFLIGAHAFFQADRLMTRDAGYYRTCFPLLDLVSI